MWLRVKKEGALRTRSLLPPLINSFNERQAHFKNIQEQIRLDKLLDYLDVQQRVYIQLCRKDRQVAELKRRRALAVRVKFHSCPRPPTTARRSKAAAGTPSRFKSSPQKNNCDVSENSASSNVADQTPVQLLAEQTPHHHHEQRPVDDDEPPHHLALLPPPVDASNTSTVEVPDDRNRTTTKQYQTIHAADQLQPIKCSDTDGRSDPCNKQSTMNQHVVPDGMPAVVERCNLVVPAAAHPRAVSASGRLLPVTSPRNNMLSTGRSDDLLRRNSALADFFLAPRKSMAEQETVSTHQTHKTNTEVLTEISLLKPDRELSVQMTRKLAGACLLYTSPSPRDS